MLLSRRSFFSITSSLSALGINTVVTRAWGQAPASYAISEPMRFRSRIQAW